ncbi:endosialidase [Synechococcus phage S-SRM01]|uniref:Endosialidase n=1 Tax=Synechococcus phage S-SRM01 TaxID=2781608 RepID=A0A879R2Y7_9CAUD|nr:endosialidase [Synechococcus phage S-SRM01]QPX47976.1 endosialidase [Synechococcus phage S-SRM01]
MSDIRVNRWLHQSGTGGVYQDSSGRVGIGTSVPTSALDIQSGSIKIGSNTLSSSGVSTFTNIVVSSGSTAVPSISPTGDSNTGIFFPAADTVAIGEGGVEVLRVDSSSNIGINSTSPARKLDVVDSGASGSVIRSRVTTNNGGYLAYEALNSSGTSVFSVTHNGRINLSENIVFASGQGLDFSATSDGSGTMSSELLADYEEGIWTPRISGTGGGDYTPGANNLGRYVKVGKIVTASATIHWTAAVTPYIGNFIVSGLPYAALSVSNYRAAGSIPGQVVGVYASGSYNMLKAGIDGSNSFVYIVMASETITSSSNYSHTPTVLSSGTLYGFTITYVSN